MTKRITLNLLTKYLYRETTPLEQMDVENALKTDYELQEQYQSMLKAKDALPVASFSPTAAVIGKIMNYSNSTTLEAQF